MASIQCFQVEYEPRSVFWLIGMVVFAKQQVIAHRGASVVAPENTLASFHQAKILGADCIEFDVMMNHEGDVYVFHDEHLGRTTNGQGLFYHATSKVLKSLDAGSWFSEQFQGEPIPTFERALACLLNLGLHANIELKPVADTSQQTTEAVLLQLNHYWPKDKPWPLISSFDVPSLAWCHEKMPELPLGLLLSEWDDGYQSAAKLDCVSVHLPHRCVTPQRVRAIKEQGQAVAVYTVNNKALAEQLFIMGVDAVFSDHPDLLT